MKLQRNGLLVRVRACLCDDFGGPVDADRPTWRYPAREIHGDCARPAAHIEQIESRSQGSQEVAGRVLRRAPRMTAQNRFVMPVGIDFLCHWYSALPRVRLLLIEELQRHRAVRGRPARANPARTSAPFEC